MDDKELIQLLQSGDRDAFKQIVIDNQGIQLDPCQVDLYVEMMDE